VIKFRRVSEASEYRLELPRQQLLFIVPQDDEFIQLAKDPANKNNVAQLEIKKFLSSKKVDIMRYMYFQPQIQRQLLCYQNTSGMQAYTVQFKLLVQNFKSEKSQLDLKGINEVTLQPNAKVVYRLQKDQPALPASLKIKKEKVKLIGMK